MKRFLINIIRFGALSLIGVIVLVILWGNYMPQLLKPNVYYRLGGSGHLFTRIQDIAHRKNVDILFIGSSHAYRGFDTRIFDKEGYISFNLGSSGQTPITGQVLLKRYLKQLNPKLVIYEVFPGSLNSDGVESSVDIIANDKNDKYAIEMALKINHLKTYNTLLVGIFRDIFNLNANFNEPREKKDERYVDGGYVQREEEHNFKNVLPKQRWIWKNNQIKAFEDNLRLIQSQGSNFILVKAPVTGRLYESFEDNKTYDKMMRTYGRYYNFNELITLQDSLHFYDLHHLNHSGVEMFNQKLLELIPIEDYLD